MNISSQVVLIAKRILRELNALNETVSVTSVASVVNPSSNFGFGCGSTVLCTVAG
jgi:hypothetical protein